MHLQLTRNTVLPFVAVDDLAVAKHIHVIPVDATLTVEEAWKEACIFGRRITFTGSEGWASVRCDGEECRLIETADSS